MADEKKALGEVWFPAGEVSVESIRERSASSALPPLYFLHVWFARRPLATSRAAILSAMLDEDYDKRNFMKLIGIPPDKDVVGAMLRFTKNKALSKTTGEVVPKGFDWPRAFTQNPPESIRPVFKQPPLIVDSMAGGGSIPFEAIRLGFNAYAADLNPVAWMCLKGTVEYPARFGKKLLPAVEEFCDEVHNEAKKELEQYYPKPDGNDVFAYLWARTITCNKCSISIPLSPNWWIVNGTDKGVAVKLRAINDKNVEFEIIQNPIKQGYDPDVGTWSGGDALCPGCGSLVDGDYIKLEAKADRMGYRMYAVCTKRRKGGGKGKEWHFRAPTKQESDILHNLEVMVKSKIPEWEKAGIVPDEEIMPGFVTPQILNFGIHRWTMLFNHRQLLAHATYMKSYNASKARLFDGKTIGTDDWDFAIAVSTYGAMIFDSCIAYNCSLARWKPDRCVIAGAMDMQAFPFKSSYAEWDHTKMLWPWAQRKVLDALKGIIELLPQQPGKAIVSLGSATSIRLNDGEANSIVVDPPYGDNVPYAEVSDFFYVWLKLTIGDLFPNEFKQELTNKEDEAITNRSRFKDVGKGMSRKLADEDYAAKMESSFKEMHRVLNDDGIMVVMFTHRKAEAWEGLANALMKAEFTFRASWPVHTEPGGKFTKADKGALKVTVLLFCRKRKENRPGRWENICDEIRDVASKKVKEYAEQGIDGPDLLVSVYGPALGVFADYYPVKDVTGKVRSPKEALDIVAEVVNEFVSVDLKGADLETMAYINLLRINPGLEVETDLARIATVFGGNTSLDTMDVKGGRGLVEKKGAKVKILTGRERANLGIINPNKHTTLHGLIDVVHAALILYEEMGIDSVKKLLMATGRDTADSGFVNVLRALARIGDEGNEKIVREARIANSLLEAMGHQPEATLKKGERITHWFE